MEQDTIQNAVGTKLVATRLPMPEYIKFLTTAMENKMSVSDLLQYKIHQEDKVTDLRKSLSDSESRIKDLEEMVSENRGYAEDWKKAAETSRLNEKKLQTELSTLKTQINALNEAEKRYKGEIATDSKTVSELKAQVTKLQGEKTTLQAEKSELLTTNKKWADAYNALKALGKQVWDEVYKHNKNNIFYDLELEKIVNKLK